MKIIYIPIYLTLFISKIWAQIDDTYFDPNMKPQYFSIGKTSFSDIRFLRGDSLANYEYYPLDPIPISIINASDRTRPLNQKLLNSLPDEIIRLAIGEIDAAGSITFKTSSIGYEGRSYVVVLDYLKFNSIFIGINIKRNEGTGLVERTFLTLSDTTDTIVPTYIGIGLRLTANVKVKKGSVNLGNLFAIGAQIEANKVSGTLIVQTLGISGKEVSSAIPMPAELNTTTVRQAIEALAKIKSLIYEENTLITPRIVGIQNTIGGTNAITSFVLSVLKNPKILLIE